MLTWQVIIMAVGVMSVTVALMVAEHQSIRNYHSNGEIMNLDNQRLREIQQFKKFYLERLKEDNTELEQDLLQIQYNKLENEEKEILERSDVKI